MTDLLLNVLLGLYPREWRNRYGGEVRELVATLKETGRRSLLGLAASLVAGATAERLYRLRRLDRAGLAAAILATAVVLGGVVVMSHLGTARHDRRAAAAQLAAARQRSGSAARAR